MTERSTPKCHVARGFKQRKIFISGSYLSFFSRNVREFCAQKRWGKIIVIIVSLLTPQHGGNATTFFLFWVIFLQGSMGNAKNQRKNIFLEYISIKSVAESM